MKGKYLSSVAAVALGAALSASGPARAQDSVWTGFYTGAYAGWAWGRSYATADFDCNSGGFLCGSSQPTAGWMYGDSFIAGLEGGYNWQAGAYVYGLETDFGAFNLNGSRKATGQYLDFFGDTGNYTVGTNFDTDWLFTFRGRLGWTTDKLFRDHDRLWLYATGGLALADLQTSFNYSDDEGSSGSGGRSKTMAGWALGAGLEYMLNPRWSAKAEYLHLDFGDLCVSGVINSGGYSQAINTCADLTADLIRFGLNYKL